MTPENAQRSFGAVASIRALVLLVCLCGAPVWQVASAGPSRQTPAPPEAPSELAPPEEPVVPKVAVFPMVNLSGVHAPMRELGESMRLHLQLNGIDTLRPFLVEQFMETHRVRYSGGLTPELGKALKEETGATAVLISSLDLYSESYPPKVALTARLVSTGDNVGILWMDGVARSGDEAPGIFDLGLISDPWKLRELALLDLTAGVGQFVYPDRKGQRGEVENLLKARTKPRRKFRPKTEHRVPVAPVEFDRPLRVAVIPFNNDSTRRNADQIMMLQFVANLVGVDGVEIIEPGIVRQTLLRSRLIMESGGLSFPQAEILRALLDADLVFAGTVLRYLDFGERTGSPEVDFSMRAIDTRSREVVWTSISYNRGDERIYFFETGRVYTAYAIAASMARSALARVLWSPPPANH